jgi:O-antigen ligase
MIILLNRYLSGLSVRSPPFPALPVIVLILPFLFAYSISALLALVAAVALILLLNRASTMRKTILIVFVGVVALNVMAVTPLYYGRITWLQKKLSDPTQREGRTKNWREIANEIRPSPLFGVGYGKFGGILQPDSAFIIENIVDNSYFLLLIQYGLVGSGLFVGLLWTIFRQAWRVMKAARDAWIRETASALLAILAAYCIIAFALNVWEMMFPINFLFWLCAGILFRLPMMDDAEGEGKTAAPSLPRSAPRVSDFRSRISDLKEPARISGRRRLPAPGAAVP